MIALFPPDLVANYWGAKAIESNLLIAANLLGALLLGMLVGYERSYNGRAAGMRTYALVCVSSCAVTVIGGFASSWYGSTDNGNVNLLGDPTRIIQGVLTGIGFLCAGVITKESSNISGLTTAASIWSASAIGVLVGLGFYAAAILLTAMSVSLMMWATRLESWLPSRHAINVTLRFRAGCHPTFERVRALASRYGYEVPSNLLQIRGVGGEQEWQCVATSLGRASADASRLTRLLARLPDITEFRVARSRN